MKTYPRVPDREGWWVYREEVRNMLLLRGDLYVGPLYSKTAKQMPDCWHGPAYRRTEDGELVAMVEVKP